MGAEKYDEDYYLRGRQTGKSLYEDYHWMPEATMPMAQTIVDHLGIKAGETILDFGCARGYLVRALRELGYTAFGYDISEWAIENGDLSVIEYLTRRLDTMTCRQHDWIIAKDVLEHCEYVTTVINNLMELTTKGVFVVVPLSPYFNNPYVIGEYEKDVTHCQRMTLNGWSNLFLHHNWSVTSQYRLPGVKDNWYKPGWERGNGFITAKRIKE